MNLLTNEFRQLWRDLDRGPISSPVTRYSLALAGILISLAMPFMAIEEANSGKYSHLWMIPFAVVFFFACCRLWSISGHGIDDQEIDFASPELLHAIEQACQTLPQFVKDATQHGTKAEVRVLFGNSDGNNRRPWAKLIELRGNSFYVALPDNWEVQGSEKAELEVPDSHVVDWRITLSNGYVRGAYTTIASFDYLKRKGMPLTRAMREEQARLIDAQ